MSKNTIVLSAAAVLLLAAWGPISTTSAQTPLLELSLGFPMDEDFNNDDGGWTTSPVPPLPDPSGSWEWGAPTSGPGFANSGSNVWATGVGQDYLERECVGLMSPPIDLSGATSATGTFWHWYHMEASTFSGNAWDGGAVFATTDGGATFDYLVPLGGYDDNAFTSVRNCFGIGFSDEVFTGPAGSTPPPASYDQVTLDLDDYTGGSVQLVLGFASDCCTERAGWFVDDFAVTTTSAATAGAALPDVGLPTDGVEQRAGVPGDVEVLYSEDFESGDGGFTMVHLAPPDAPLGWEWGMPGAGPDPVSNLWGTHLNGDYGAEECAWIESPAFTVGDLPNVENVTELIANVTLSWNQWYDSSGFSAGGIVQVGLDGEYHKITPSTGYPDPSVSTSLADCLGSNQDVFAGDLNPSGEMIEYQADMTDFIGQEVTIRYLFASTSSTLRDAGWYVDDVSVEYGLSVAAPSLDDLVPGLPVVGGADAPGWTQGGDDSSWAYGTVTDDDVDSPTGDIAYGTNLDGSHNTNECSFITSPAVPGAVVAADPTLTFDHWYRMAFAFSATTATGGVVLVSGDGGVTWDYLALDDYERPTNPSYAPLRNCLDAHGVDVDAEVFTGVKTQWDTVTADLSAYADSPTVQVRFLFGSHTSLAYEGWYIENVEIGGVDVL